MKSLILILSILYSLSSLANSGSEKFIFAVVQYNGQTEIWLNPLSEWEANERLSDGYTLEQRKFIEPIIDEAKLCNLSDSSYEPCGFILQDSLNILKQHGVSNHKEFQQWAETQI